MQVKDFKDFTRELSNKIKTWYHFHSPVVDTFENFEQHDVAQRAFTPVRFYLQEIHFFLRRKLTIFKRINRYLMYRLVTSHRYHYIYTGLEPGYYDLDIRFNNAMYHNFLHFYQRCSERYVTELESAKANRTWKELLMFKKPVLDLFEIGKQAIMEAGGLTENDAVNWRSIPMDHDFTVSTKNNTDYPKLLHIYMWYHIEYLVYVDLEYNDMRQFIKERGYASQMYFEDQYTRYASILFDLKALIWD